MVRFQSPSYFISRTLLGLFVEDKVGAVEGSRSWGGGRRWGQRCQQESLSKGLRLSPNVALELFL